MNRLLISAILFAVTSTAASAVTTWRHEVETTLQTRYVSFDIGTDGRSIHLLDRRTGEDVCVPSPFACVTKDGKTFDASSAAYAGGRLSLKFGESGVRAVVWVEEHHDYLEFEVLSVSGRPYEMSFCQLSIKPPADDESGLFICAMALNLETKVPNLPGANLSASAQCYERFGHKGAKVALVASPITEMRRIMQDIVIRQDTVAKASGLPASNLGGPWALDHDVNRGSYIFNFADLTAATADEWIERARRYGMNQIDMHGGVSFRHGDCRPNPAMYPNGRADLKAAIDKLHAAGIKVGLHPYAFFMAKDCPWITPVPDPRLAKDATFTLAEPMSADSTEVVVAEPTEKMSTTTGFFVRNGLTLQVDDELITFEGISKEPPYAFTGCQRGAYGTSVSAHAKGAKVHHLKECFFLFAPDGDSTLLTEVAEKVAETFNECGFDMIYLDALDGEDVLAGSEWGWHYGSKFVFEICKRLRKPALMEMSTFHHHLWYVRSRFGAWDHPYRGHKRYIDLHCAHNAMAEKMFMPAHLGWWAMLAATDANAFQTERTYPDDIEYLAAKCIATGTGFSLTHFGPDTPGYTRLADICRQYEDLRHADYFSDDIKAKLRVPGDEYTLEKSPDGGWQLREIRYEKHKADRDETRSWSTVNEFGEQPVALRIEALHSAAPFDSPDGMVIADFADPAEFAHKSAREGVSAELVPSTEDVKFGEHSGLYTATSTRNEPNGSWSKLGKLFSPTVDMSAKQALGLWVHGDGRGEVINLQLMSPDYTASGYGDHFIEVDFTGWKYFELIEPEGDRTDDYAWPHNGHHEREGYNAYGHAYGVYREHVDYSRIETLSLWYNDLPKGDGVKCLVSPVKALPLVKNTLKNPKVTIGGREITFPVEMPTGSWLEFNSMEDCTLYAPNGEILQRVKPLGDAPILKKGGNAVRFECGSLPGINPRAWVTVITKGRVLD